MKKQKLMIEKETGLRVYEGNELHFNDYLRQQVGAGWYIVRNMLYEAGYIGDYGTFRSGGYC